MAAQWWQDTQHGHRQGGHSAAGANTEIRMCVGTGEAATGFLDGTWQCKGEHGGGGNGKRGMGEVAVKRSSFGLQLPNIVKALLSGHARQPKLGEIRCPPPLPPLTNPYKPIGSSMHVSTLAENYSLEPIAMANRTYLRNHAVCVFI